MIEILNQQKRHRINKDKFKSLLHKLFSHYKIQNAEITLAFVTNQVIRDLNRKFLNKNTFTDVLSFPIREKGADGRFYLGDIIISAPQAFRQCSREKHGLERELEYLTIHGFLHLNEYEHFKGLEEEEGEIRKLLFRNKSTKT
jgi:probable rRNA maturation factor